MIRTNPFRGSNHTDAHRCSGCDTPLYLTGKRRVLRTFLVNLPAMFISAAVGLFLATQVKQLLEPTAETGDIGLVGFLVTLILFVVPAVYAMMRFEHVAKYEGKI